MPLSPNGYAPLFPILWRGGLCYTESMVKPTSVLIIAPPGRLRDSLRVLLYAAGVAQVNEADAFAAGLATLTRTRSELVVLTPAHR
jgi:hypothetical protein